MAAERQGLILGAVQHGVAEEAEEREGGWQKLLPSPCQAPFGTLFLGKPWKPCRHLQVEPCKGPSTGPEPQCPRASQTPVLLGTKIPRSCTTRGLMGQSSLLWV